MYECAGSKSAKLVVTESGKLVARFLQSIACLTRVRVYNKISHVALCFAVFHSTFTTLFSDKKSKRSQKTVEIKLFLAIFA
jgi:hypothetical protein